MTRPAFDEAVALTRAVLAAGGLATLEEGGVRGAVVALAAPGYVTAPELANLALDARDSTAATISIEEFGQLLTGFGLDIDPAVSPGEYLLGVLRTWAAAAREHPDDPLAFSGRFIAEQAKRRAGSADLEDAAAQPTEVRLGLLELYLFLAGIQRVLAPANPSLALEPEAAFRFASQPQLDPCDILTDWTGRRGGSPEGNPIADEVDQRIIDELLEKKLEREFGSRWAGRVSNALTTLNATSTVIKLIAFYRSVGLEVVPDVKEVHKPLASTSSGTTVNFVARLKLDEAEMERYRRMMGDIPPRQRECLQRLGLPDTDPSLLTGAERWRVTWQLLDPGGHAVWNNRNFDFPGHQAMYLGSAKQTKPFVVTVLPEDQHEGRMMGMWLTARADLRTDSGRDVINIILSTQGLGVGTVIQTGNLITNLIRNLASPHAHGQIRLTYHEPEPWKLRLTHTIRYAGGGSDVLIREGELTEVSPGRYEGTFLGTLLSRNGQICWDGSFGPWESRIRADVTVQGDRRLVSISISEGATLGRRRYQGYDEWHSGVEACSIGLDEYDRSTTRTLPQFTLVDSARTSEFSIVEGGGRMVVEEL